MALPVAYVLLGPTASGKSRLAMELAAGTDLEIVSVDSAQVFRGMDIGTAKPSAQERRAVPHHLIDVALPVEPYSAARFCEDAVRAVQDILARGRRPLLVGGTMLYYRALTLGLDPLPGADVATRLQIDAEAQRLGWDALHAELARADPVAAARIHRADRQRIQRALEVFRLTGQPMSALQRGEPRSLPFELRTFALVPEDRAELHGRIAARFEAMLEAGLVDELRTLRHRYAMREEMPSMRCVGYRQAWRYLEGDIDAEELRLRGIAATRQLAKRRLTWLRSFRGIAPAADLGAALARR